MRADYQLKHQLYGQQGSLWESQVDDVTRRCIRRIVKEGGNAPLLAEVDQIVAGVLNADTVLVEDVFFLFSSGNYAVVGQLQRDYSFRLGDLGNGLRLHVAYRGPSAATETDAIPTHLARISNDFLRAVDSADFPADRDWYLIPVPREVTPLVIEGRDGAYLVNGIDFVARDGYIAMTDDPEPLLPTGLVRVNSAKLRVFVPDAFAASETGRRGVGRYIAEYAHKSQSLGAFKRAAAEYAGLYVTQSADVVLDVHAVSEGVMVYNLASAGPVEISYPHAALTKHQHLPPGFIVCDRFDVVASRYSETVNLKQLVASSWGGGIMLDGILPVKGLTWDGKSNVPMDYVASGESPHLRLHFDGPPDALARFWEFQRLHELKTGIYLYDALGDPDTPSTLDFWDFLETFYGPQLCLVLLSNHTPRINTRMWRFVLEHRPQSCNVLLGLDLGVDIAQLVTNSNGIPLLDEVGEDFYDAGDPLDGYDNYYRPDGIGLYLRPSGRGYYLRP